MQGLRPILIASMLLLVVGPLSAQQTVYQWKDAKGVTHYTDTPPPGNHKVRAISQHAGAAPATAAAPQDAAKSAQETRCSDARANLVRLKGAQPVGFDSDGDGKPDRDLTEQERAAQTELNQAAINAWCGQG